MAAGDPTYLERLVVPVLWWVLAVLLAASSAVAAGFYLGLGWGLGAGLGTLVVAAAVLLSASARISVQADAVRVGRAVLELAYVGDCRALDAEQTTRRTGRDADARAYLVLRPYVATAVEIEVTDAIDPTPYWLVSTRHPRRLAAAVRTARDARLSR